ncbi:Transmembrane prediction [Planctomycetales bacterium 10988]|nr:Transmembrane prediction [Planctomycetales bacterium 10988]
MAHSTDIRLLDATCSRQTIAYRTPMKFGGRVMNEAVLLNVTIKVETRDGRQATGFGSMPMNSTWAWPSSELTNAQTLEAMLVLADHLCLGYDDYGEYGHPLEITYELETEHDPSAEGVREALGLSEPMPRLAQLVVASPFEAAIHDAFGMVLRENSYNLLGSDYVNRDLGSYLGPDFSGETLDMYTLRKPKPRMPLYHLVGALDPLTEADIPERLNDDIPETLGEWITKEGLTHLKIKLAGDDLDWDVNRVVSIEKVAAEAQTARGCEEWFYSLDFNERCESVEYVLEFLRQLQEKSPAGYDRVQYLEQPTNRDLKNVNSGKMHEAAKLKPVVIDESLTDLESLLLARDLGYSGVALKACKGQTGALFMAAAAQKYEMFLCVQDLTCPGASFLHSASLSARIPTVAAIEGNARQYCPSGNQGWTDAFPGMFIIQDGTLDTSMLEGPGLCLGNLPRPPKW